MQRSLQKRMSIKGLYDVQSPLQHPSSLRPHEGYSLVNPEHSRLKLGCTYLLGLKTSSYDQTICFCIHNWRTKEEIALLVQL